MNEPAKLLQRLAEIGLSLSNTPHALALIGLGSSGQELERMDRFSDLDFFVLVESGHRTQFLEDLSWLSRIAPIAFEFMNTQDGYKLLFGDGIFCEFAVFEPEQLAQAAFTAGRVIWKTESISDTIIQSKPLPSGQAKTMDWMLGEALTNLYVGLGREHRGEKLSAMRFIQGYAVDRITELSAFITESGSSSEDVFDPARRYEVRYPSLAINLPNFLQGYDKNSESALAILDFLDYHFDINEPLKLAIMNLISLKTA